MLYVFGLALHLIISHSDALFAMDTKCEIKSSCSQSGCQTHTDPMTVDPDSNITLNCTIISGGLARDMTWRQVKSSTGLSNLALEHSNSTQSDGKYSCRCTTIKFARALRIVMPFTSSPVTIIQDKETNIQCVFSGWPLPHTVYWLKNSKLITNGTEGISHLLQRKRDSLYSILSLPPGREDQEGDYECHATNGIPGWTSSKSRVIKMFYKCPQPIGPTISNPEQLAEIFSNVTLTCSIDWDPDDVYCPEYQEWLLPRNGIRHKESLEDTGSKCKKELVLSIFNVTENEEGTYSCYFYCTYRNTTKAIIDLKVFVPETKPPTEFPTSTEYGTTSSQSKNHSEFSTSTEYGTTSSQSKNHSESRRKVTMLQAVLISSVGIVIILVALFVWWLVAKKRRNVSQTTMRFSELRNLVEKTA